MRKKWLARSVLWAACLLLALLLVSGTYAVVTYFYTQRQFHAFWQPFSRTEQNKVPVTIVLPDPPLRLPLPAEQPFSRYIGLGDALALAQTIEVLRDRGTSRDLISVIRSKDAVSKSRRIQGPEIIIGGPNSSRRSLKIMAHLLDVNDPDDPASLKQGFQFVVGPKGRTNAMSVLATKKREDGSWRLGIRDAKTGESAEVEIQGDSVIVDAALVIRGIVNGRDVLVVSGYEDTGTFGGLRAVAEAGPILNKFNEMYEQFEYAEMVIQTKPGTSDPVLVQFPTIKNPRGKSHGKN